MQEIKNEYLKVLVNNFGATLYSIYDLKNNKEILWQADHEKSWTGRDVAIFPVVARLVDGYYTVDGIRYDIPSHGLCRHQQFEVEKISDSEVKLSFLYNEETLKQYPFKFRFSITYKLDKNKVTVAYLVENLDNKTMYFELGGHPALSITGLEKADETDISGNYLEFEKTMHPKNYLLDDAGYFIRKAENYKPFKVLNLTKEIMREYKTLMFFDEEFNKVTLVKKDGSKVIMELNNPKVLAIWSHEYYGAYVCVEPWFGIPDSTQPIRELKDKENVNSLDMDSVFAYEYSIIMP